MDKVIICPFCEAKKVTYENGDWGKWYCKNCLHNEKQWNEKCNKETAEYLWNYLKGICNGTIK